MPYKLKNKKMPISPLRIYTYRMNLGLTMVQAGTLCGWKYPAETWNAYESGRISCPGKATRLKITDALGVKERDIDCSADPSPILTVGDIPKPTDIERKVAFDAGHKEGYARGVYETTEIDPGRDENHDRGYSKGIEQGYADALAGKAPPPLSCWFDKSPLAKLLHEAGYPIRLGPGEFSPYSLEYLKSFMGDKLVKTPTLSSIPTTATPTPITTTDMERIEAVEHTGNIHRNTPVVCQPLSEIILPPGVPERLRCFHATRPAYVVELE